MDINILPQKDLCFQENNCFLYNADAIDILKILPENYIDSVITDPPYGLSIITQNKIRETLSEWLIKENENFIPSGKGFMSKNWDSFVPPPALWKEIYRVMKPGAIALVFAGTRTYDLMTISLRLAGFEIKDTLMWIYSKGFPKSLDIYKELNKQNINNSEWEGYKTALKPAFEPIIMAMKNLDNTYIENAIKWGVAGLNTKEASIPIDKEKETDKRVGTDIKMGEKRGLYGRSMFISNIKYGSEVYKKEGRYPSNILLDEESAKVLDKQTEILNIGNVSRFFYVAKASKKEREEFNNHPTVKPIKLLEYLCILTKPPRGGIVLDPFAGSGSTLVACYNTGRNCIGIEIQKEYCEIAKKRISQIKINNY